MTYDTEVYQANKSLVEDTVKHVYGPERVEYSNEEVIVLCLVRNGYLYIEEFIKHYFSLGVKHIVFLDNNDLFFGFNRNALAG